jgi:hypothetical protein
MIVKEMCDIFLTFAPIYITLSWSKLGGILRAISSVVEHQSYKLGVVGSKPTSPTIILPILILKYIPR